MSTEGQVSNDDLMALMDVVASATLPLASVTIRQETPGAANWQGEPGGGAAC